jgi:hypothetical protein
MFDLTSPQVRYHSVPLARSSIVCLDPQQQDAALEFLRFRALLPEDPADDAETAERAAQMLLADETSPVSVRMMGVTDLDTWNADADPG